MHLVGVDLPSWSNDYADCTSTQEDLVPLERANSNVNDIREGASVSVDGVLNSIRTEENFVLQVRVCVNFKFSSPDNLSSFQLNCAQQSVT